MTPGQLASALFDQYKIHTVGIVWENISCVRVTPHVYTTIGDLDKMADAVTTSPPKPSEWEKWKSRNDEISAEERTPVAIMALVALAFIWLSFVLCSSAPLTSATAYSVNLQTRSGQRKIDPDPQARPHVPAGVERSGRIQHASGTWRKLGEGGVVFSKEFLVLTGQEPAPTVRLMGRSTKLSDWSVKSGSERLRRGMVRQGHQFRGSILVWSYAGDEEGVPATLIIRQIRRLNIRQPWWYC